MRNARLVAVLALALPALAQEPEVFISHYGRLLDGEDNPVAGTITLTVRLYSRLDGNSEDIVWFESYSVTPFRGEYALLLGDTRNDKKKLTAADVAGDRWLALVIDGEELTPRLRMGSVPDALNARALGGVPASEWAKKTDTVANAEKLGDLPASSYALAGHHHDAAYAELGHAHATSYSPLGHDHAAVYQPIGAYAATSHNHEGVYAPSGSYAVSTHDHNAAYSLLAHNHDGVYLKPSSGGDLSVTGTGVFGMLLVAPRSGAPPTCDANNAGRIYFDQATKAFYGCNGTSWAPFAAGAVGTQDNPGLSCLDIRNRTPSVLQDALYWVDTDGLGGGNAAFQVWCDMTSDGGGWALVYSIRNGSTSPSGTGAVSTGNLLTGSPTAAGKYTDAVINGLAQSSEYRYQCGSSYRRYFKLAHAWSNATGLVTTGDQCRTSPSASWVTITSGACTTAVGLASTPDGDGCGPCVDRCGGGGNTGFWNSWHQYFGSTSNNGCYTAGTGYTHGLMWVR
jgi:hypothetical protein